jgi:hypothetical protein
MQVKPQHLGSENRQSRDTLSSAPLSPIPDQLSRALSYGPPWAHYLGGYQDRLLGGPLGLPDLRCTEPTGVKHKDYGGVLG